MALEFGHKICFMLKIVLLNKYGHSLLVVDDLKVYIVS